MKYLKKNDVTLQVADLYPFRYDYGKGKTVLRIRIPETVSFSAIQNFFEATADYAYWEGEDGAEECKNIYTQYGADLDIHYKKPADTPEADDTVTHAEAYYDIEVMRDPAIEATVRTLQAANAALTQQAAQLSADNDALAARADEAELILATALYGGDVI